MESLVEDRVEGLMTVAAVNCVEEMASVIQLQQEQGHGLHGAAHFP
jgi:hypothetical protein